MFTGDFQFKLKGLELEEPSQGEGTNRVCVELLGGGQTLLKRFIRKAECDKCSFSFSAKHKLIDVGTAKPMI